MNKRIVMIAVLAVLTITSGMIGFLALSTDNVTEPSQIAQSEPVSEVMENITEPTDDDKNVNMNEAQKQDAEMDTPKNDENQVVDPPSPSPQVKQTEKPAQPTVSRGEARTITVVATGYTDAPEENYPWAGAPSYIGLPLERGIVAVDPHVIPMGTKLYIEGYGEGIAADQGGAIKGNRIDLFFDTKAEAFDWGMRTVEVTVIP